MGNLSLLPWPEHHFAVWWKGRLMAGSKLCITPKSATSRECELPFMGLSRDAADLVRLGVKGPGPRDGG